LIFFIFWWGFIIESPFLAGLGPLEDDLVVQSVDIVSTNRIVDDVIVDTTKTIITVDELLLDP
jgi:hypothetical protein